MPKKVKKQTFTDLFRKMASVVVSQKQLCAKRHNLGRYNRGGYTSSAQTSSARAQSFLGRRDRRGNSDLVRDI